MKSKKQKRRKNNQQLNCNDLHRIIKIYNQEMKNRRNEDYIPDPTQMSRFHNILHFFEEHAEDKYDERVEAELLQPREQHGGLNARFCTFDICGEEIHRFSELLNNCSAFSIDALTNGQVCISLTIPNLYKRKE